MAEVLAPGQSIKSWTLDRDERGHRTYNVTWHVLADGKEGPGVVMEATGLPTIGSVWNFFGELDPWAFCTPYLKVRPVKQGHASVQAGRDKTLWLVDQKFSTLPLERCNDTSIENPLAEPDQISGSFVTRSFLYDRDRNDNPIKTISFERVQVEYPRGYPTVQITQNKLSLPLSQYSEAHNSVNELSMWGLDPRTIRLDNISWERRLYATCFYYYPTTFEYDIDIDTFDLSDVPQESEMVLDGQWDETSGLWVNVAGVSQPSTDPTDYIRFIDKNGNPGRTYLNAAGNPAIDEATIAYLPKIEISDEYNFFLLGMPTTLA